MASFPEKKRVRSTGHRLQPTPPAAPAGPQPPPLSRPLWICGNQREYSRHAARTSSATHDPDGATVSRPPRRRRSPALLRGRFRTLFFALLAIAAIADPSLGGSRAGGVAKVVVLAAGGWVAATRPKRPPARRRRPARVDETTGFYTGERRVHARAQQLLEALARVEAGGLVDPGRSAASSSCD